MCFVACKKGSGMYVSARVDIILAATSCLTRAYHTHVALFRCYTKIDSV